MVEAPHIVITVTNHAVNRYLSRIDRTPRVCLPGDAAFEAIRAKIYRLVESGIRAGASAVKCNGAKFRTRKITGHSGVHIVRVTTVTR
jgi:hypothetical protein